MPCTKYYWTIGRTRAGEAAPGVWSFTTTCVSAISPASVSVMSEISTPSVTVTAPAGSAWTAVSNAIWITVTSPTGGAGSGNGTVSLTVAADPGAARACTVFITGWTFTVAQAGLPITTGSYVISTTARGSLPPTAVAATLVQTPVQSTQSIASDAAGNVYFASQLQNSVFKVDTTGVMTRIAGTGVAGYSGDSGPWLQALN